ncbi:MAG: hypothetical protein VST68_02760 [Nitrospirota bacterium]|nr:hypothetical protein [Nitrospirota bacterium]
MFLRIPSFVGLLNISLTWPINSLGEINISSRWEWSKKSVQQGRSHFDARSVLTVREHGNMARTPLAAFFNVPFMVNFKTALGSCLRSRENGFEFRDECRSF